MSGFELSIDCKFRKIIHQNQLLHKLSEHQEVIISLNHTKHCILLIEHKNQLFYNCKLDFNNIGFWIGKDSRNIRYPLGKISIKNFILCHISGYLLDLSLMRKIHKLPGRPPLQWKIWIGRLILQSKNIFFPISHLNPILRLKG